MSIDESDNLVLGGEESGLAADSEVDAEPLQPVSDGRDNAGRFEPGNTFSRGNAVGRKTAKFRDRLFKSVTKEDFTGIVGQLIDEAKKGRPWAVKLALEYLCGGPEDVVQDRLLILERLILRRE